MLMTVGFFFSLPLTSVLYVCRDATISTEKCTDSAPSIIKYFITRKDFLGYGWPGFVISCSHKVRSTRYRSQLWLGPPGPEQRWQWQRRDPADGEVSCPQVSHLSCCPHLPTTRKTQCSHQSSGPPNSCVLKTCGLAWAEQKNVKYFVCVCSETNHLPIHQLQQWNNVPKTKDPTSTHCLPCQNHPCHFLFQNQLGFIFGSSCCSVFLTRHVEH